MSSSSSLATNLLTKWNNILKFSNLQIGEKSNKWWSIINERYSETQRFYHNLTHIGELLKLEEEFSSKLKSKESVKFAIFFHDIVYDPTRGDNEDQSAELFLQFSNDLKLPSDLTSLVYKYIMATKNHTSVDTNGDTDLDYFLDMDLSILGTDFETYSNYSKAIRMEYIHIPDNQYKQGRSKILQKFIDSGYSNLFRTQDFRDRYGQSSINNLKIELERLNQS